MYSRAVEGPLPEGALDARPGEDELAQRERALQKPERDDRAGGGMRDARRAESRERGAGRGHTRDDHAVPPRGRVARGRASLERADGAAHEDDRMERPRRLTEREGQSHCAEPECGPAGPPRRAPTQAASAPYSASKMIATPAAPNAPIAPSRMTASRRSRSPETKRPSIESASPSRWSPPVRRASAPRSTAATTPAGSTRETSTSVAAATRPIAIPTTGKYASARGNAAAGVATLGKGTAVRKPAATSGAARCARTQNSMPRWATIPRE